MWITTRMCVVIFVIHNIYGLAGHPLRGWPARLRGHKGSGLWKVSSPLPSPPLPSPHSLPPLPSPSLPSPPLPSPPLPSPPSPPSPALPCPALPCPALPCPALPCPALPSPALPSPALPSPPLPSPPLPSPPLPPLPSPPLPSPLPPSLPRAKFDQAGSSRLAEARECGAALAISEWTLWSSWVQPFGRSARVWRRPGDQRVKTKADSHDRANAQRNSFFWSGITRAVIRIGTNEWPSTRPEG